MIPTNALSTQAVVSAFTDTIRGAGEYLQDYETAGIALNDGTAGMQVKLWTARVTTDRLSVEVSADGVPWTLLFTRVRPITEIALAFDNNMRPFVVFLEQGGAGYIYWYDPTDNVQKVSEMPAGMVTPRCCIDDHRQVTTDSSDVVLTYLRGGSLYVRYQRERYGVEHLMQDGLGPRAQIVDAGMAASLRLQWLIRQANNVPAAGLAYDAPFLGDIVRDLLERSGVPAAKIDTSELYSDLVEGYRIAIEGGADAMIQPLQAAWFFDPSESDGKLRFHKRDGRSPVVEITPDDLVERDEAAMEIERVQEAELLRKVNVTTVDSSIDYATSKQTAERRTGTVLATGESSIEIPITAAPDFAASVALRRIKTSWGEPQKYRYTLPIAFSLLTPADIVTARDKRGRVHRQRIMQIDEDSGRLEVEAQEHAPWAYDAQAEGIVAEPPTSTTPGLVGDTRVVIVDIPPQRDQDDELGVYVGVAGDGSGWYGAEVQMSTDGGASVGQYLQVAVPANIGETLSALVPEISPQYLSAQTLRVRLPFAVESISRESLLRYGNRLALQYPDGSWEVLQFETATALGDSEYLLGGLVRGRCATATGAVPAGAVVVVLDEALVFVQLQQWMRGQVVSYRAVSYGQDSDEVDWADYEIGNTASQTEWPPHMLRAVRAGGSVTLSWVGRGRMGVEVAPRQGRYFTGYRVVYSDGYTADVADSPHTRAGAPTGVTAYVVALNSITGPGRPSEAIAT